MKLSLMMAKPEFRIRPIWKTMASPVSVVKVTTGLPLASSRAHYVPVSKEAEESREFCTQQSHYYLHKKKLDETI